MIFFFLLQVHLTLLSQRLEIMSTKELQDVLYPVLFSLHYKEVSTLRELSLTAIVKTRVAIWPLPTSLQMELQTFLSATNIPPVAQFRRQYNLSRIHAQDVYTISEAAAYNYMLNYYAVSWLRNTMLPKVTHDLHLLFGSTVEFPLSATAYEPELRYFLTFILDMTRKADMLQTMQTMHGFVSRAWLLRAQIVHSNTNIRRIPRLH